MVPLKHSPETNMEPKNGGLEDDFPFQTGDFPVQPVITPISGVITPVIHLEVHL